MRSEIDANFRTLMDQGPATALHYYHMVVGDLAEQLEISKDRVRKDMETTVLALCRISCDDYNSALRQKIFQEEMDKFQEILAEISSTLGNAFPESE